MRSSAFIFIRNSKLPIFFLSISLFNLFSNLDLIFLPEEDVFFEHKLLGNYQLSTKYILSAGYKLTHGSYPFGKQWDVFPIIDLSWRWEK